MWEKIGEKEKKREKERKIAKKSIALPKGIFSVVQTPLAKCSYLLPCAACAMCAGRASPLRAKIVFDMSFGSRLCSPLLPLASENYQIPLRDPSYTQCGQCLVSCDREITLCRFSR